MIYVGIDPGTGGGIAMITERGEVLRAIKMPETVRDIIDALHLEGTYNHATGVSTVEPNTIPMHAVLEQVNAGVFGHGKAGRMGVSSAFTFGRGYGRLEASLAAARIPFDYAQPAKWQQVMGCRSRGDKNVTKGRAQQLFPSLKKITHAIADALLIAEFCRRTRGQQHGEEKDRRAQGRTEAREGPGTEGSEEVERFVRRGQAAQRAVGAALERPAQSGAPRHGDRAQSKTRQHL